jgi:hypothetical protein
LKLHIEKLSGIADSPGSELAPIDIFSLFDNARGKRPEYPFVLLIIQEAGPNHG